VGLSASFASAAAAGQRLDALYLFAPLLIEGCVGEVDVPVQAGVRVVLLFSGWVRVGCTRLSSGSMRLLLVGRTPGGCLRAGPFLYLS
jgi:hypothetical protein